MVSTADLHDCLCGITAALAGLASDGAAALQMFESVLMDALNAGSEHEPAAPESDGPEST